MFCKEVGLTSQQSGFSGFDNIGIIFTIITKGQFWASLSYRSFSPVLKSDDIILVWQLLDKESFLMKDTKSIG